MKVIYQFGVGRGHGIELTRRNLLTLLAKLDEPHSARTIRKEGFFVRAVEDIAHYVDVEAGRMSPTTEAAIKRMRGEK